MINPVDSKKNLYYSSSVTLQEEDSHREELSTLFHVFGNILTVQFFFDYFELLGGSIQGPFLDMGKCHSEIRRV